MAETNDINDIHDVINGFTREPAGQDYSKFRDLCEALQEFFGKSKEIKAQEEASQMERNLVIATLRCIEYYLRYLKIDFSEAVAEFLLIPSESESEKASGTAKLAATDLIGLLMTASDHITRFGDTMLSVRYSELVTLACDFVPSLDSPPSGPVCRSNTARFLETVDQCISEIASGRQPSLSAASSVFSEEVVTPSDVAFDPLMCAIAGHSCQTSTPTAEEKDVDLIISGGLGLLDGKRAHSRGSGSNASSPLSDPPSLEIPEPEQEVSPPADDSSSRASPSTDIRPEVKKSPKKRKRAWTLKKKATKKRKTSLAQSSPDKENMQQSTAS